MKTHKLLLQFVFGLLLLGGKKVVFSQTDFWQPANGSVDRFITTFVTNSNGHIFVGTRNGISVSTNNGDSWSPITNELVTGHITSLAIDSSGNLFAGINGDGVFHSTDNGNRWKPTSLTNGFVPVLAINSKGHVFASTGRNLFRSTDRGDNWIPLSLTDVHVSSIVFTPNEHIFAATSGKGKDVFHSTDNGDKWTPIGLTDYDIRTLAINSRGHLFAGMYNGNFNFGGIFRSTNNGETWTAINNGLGNPYVNAIILDPIGQLFAITNGGVFRSTDNGDHWTSINDGLPETPNEQ
ncbi:hypothetical protein L0337_35625 [candidate division KSB1 bacterium]|nr:hypothetical protein [candidate division KSB1 bacterium]